MPWHTQFHPEYGVVETAYCGLLSPPELQSAVEATLALAREHGSVRFLSDCTTLEGGHSVFDLYALLDVLESWGFRRGWKEALLFPLAEDSTAADDVLFWQTACSNRGFFVRIFRDRTEALCWLTE